MGILVLEFGSLEILHIEQHAPGANITTASDALWYVIVTISTVGYGDQYPVTNERSILSARSSSSSASASSAPSPATWPTSSSRPARSRSPPTHRRSQSTEVLAVSQLRELVAKQQSAIDELKLLLGPEQT